MGNFYVQAGSYSRPGGDSGELFTGSAVYRDRRKYSQDSDVMTGEGIRP